MEVKEIFLKAAELMESGYSRWMCICIKYVLDPERSPHDVKIPENFADYGFNKENYTKFIENNYPELKKYIFSFTEHNFPWIDTWDTIPEFESVIESKIEFLKSLANEFKWYIPKGS